MSKRKVNLLLNTCEDESEKAYLQKVNLATGVMISIFQMRKDEELGWRTGRESLEEGFAEWVSNKIVKHDNKERQGDLQIFQRLEEKLGQRQTLKIGLTAANDKEFSAVISKYL